MRKTRIRHAFFAIAALLIVGTDPFAADKTFTWVNPTANEDGTALDLATLTLYEFGCTSIDDQNYQFVASFPASLPLPTSRTVSLPPGEYWCVLRVATAQQTSAWSNESFFTVPHPVPNAPTGLAVN